MFATEKTYSLRFSVKVMVRCFFPSGKSAMASMALSIRFDSTLHISQPEIGSSFHVDVMFSVTCTPAFSHAASFTCKSALIGSLAVFSTRLTAVMRPYTFSM